MPYKLHRRLGLWRKLCSEGVRVPPSDTAFSRSFVSNSDVCSPVTASGARGVPSASAHIQWCRSCLWMSLQQLIQSLFSQERLGSCDIWPRPWSAWGWRQQCRHQTVDFGCLHLQPLPKFPVTFWPPPGVIWRHSCPQAPDCLCGFPLLSFFFFFCTNPQLFLTKVQTPPALCRIDLFGGRLTGRLTLLLVCVVGVCVLLAAES